MDEQRPPATAGKDVTIDRVFRWVAWAVIGAVTFGGLIWALLIDRPG